jgi:protein-tyrosine-phosphatase
MKSVLFVCVHNSGRSQIAEAFFNYLAKGNLRAFSAGTKPSTIVDPTIIEVMLEVGIDISEKRPKALTLEMIEKADLMITMGCGADIGCPARYVKTEDWQLEDPTGRALEQVRAIRDDIKARVIRLIEEIRLKDD